MGLLCGWSVIVQNYRIQKRVHVMVRLFMKRPNFSQFEIAGAKYSHWFSDCHTNANQSSYLLIEDNIKANGYERALSLFHTKHMKILSQLSLLSQCYCEGLYQPYLITKKESDLACFYYVRDTKGVPASFNENSLLGLKVLQNNSLVPNQFFLYWQDMLNTSGYSAKLLLMCSALEALASSALNTHTGTGSKYSFFVEVLGEDLKDAVWKQKVGVRHRLMHGEYFDYETDRENYLQKLYDKIIEYFNRTVFENTVIRSITNPQRRPDGNKLHQHYWLKGGHDSSELNLRRLVLESDRGYASENNQGFYDFINKFEEPSEAEIDDF